MAEYRITATDPQDAALVALMGHENDIRAAINGTLQKRRDDGEKNVPEDREIWTPETYLQALVDPILDALQAERKEADTKDIAAKLAFATEKDLEIVRGVLGLEAGLEVKRGR